MITTIKTHNGEKLGNPVSYKTGDDGRGLWIYETIPCQGWGQGHENCEKDHPRGEWKQIIGTCDFRTSRKNFNSRIHAMFDDELSMRAFRS